MPELATITDVNITLGQWPMRRVPCDQLDKLRDKLRTHSVTEAWAGHFDGLFHADLTDANNRLAQACTSDVPLAPLVHSSKQIEALAKPVTPKASAMKFIPFGEINPLAPNWEAEFNRCAQIHKMPGVRLHPNYHNYKLDHPKFARLLKAAAERNLLVQLTVLMEDARMMHPLMRVPPVDIRPLEKLLSQMPNLRVILLNALTTASRTDQLNRLLNAGEVYVEIAMLETIAALETLLKDVPAERILFGSHTPSLYFEAAKLKLQESALSPRTVRAICWDNARRALGFGP